MRHQILRTLACATLLIGLGVSAASADVCVAADEPHDTLSTSDRKAALLLLGTQFEQAGEHVVPIPCGNQYSVSHIQLGKMISVTLVGPTGRRDATAIGLEDLPAIYNQMVRSLLTGRPMHGVVDRTNVSETQTAARRVGSDSIFYARLGYGAIFGNSAQGVPSVGLLGYRHELDSFGIDVSFLNFQFKSSRASGSYGTYGYYGGSSTVASASYVKLEGLYFMRPLATQTAYVGGGMSWGGTSSYSGSQSWDGHGLQGELTAGYEVARASTVRLFVQADAGLPFYRLTSTTYSRTGVVVDQQWAPSLTVSMGLGWQRGGRTRGNTAHIAP